MQSAAQEKVNIKLLELLWGLKQVRNIPELQKQAVTVEEAVQRVEDAQGLHVEAQHFWQLPLWQRTCWSLPKGCLQHAL